MLENYFSELHLLLFTSTQTAAYNSVLSCGCVCRPLVTGCFLFVLYFNGSEKCFGNKNQDTKINETMSKHWYFWVETNNMYAMDILTLTWDFRK